MSEKEPQLSPQVDQERKTGPREQPTSTPDEIETQEIARQARLADLRVQEEQIRVDDRQKINMIRNELGLNVEHEAGNETMTFESASEILGGDRVFGIDNVREYLGVHLQSKDIPPITYTRVQLEKAKAEGATLVLRVDTFDDGTPLTLENLTQRFPGSVSGEITGNQEEDSWAAGSKLLSTETPRREWKLVRTGEFAAGTEHLSFEAQDAFMKKDYEALGKAMDRMTEFWDSLTAGPPRETIEDAKNKIPSLDELKTLRESLPEGAELPQAIEVVYDFLVSGKRTLPNDLEIATQSTVGAGFGEPVERPVDVGFTEEGIKVHTRRDMRFGRPNALGDKKPGIAIGYIQY